MAAMFPIWRMLALFLPLGALMSAPQGKDQGIPAFGRDTVLVYRSSNENESAFVVRIAEFNPDRFVEWEDATTQGTIFMPAKAVESAREYVNWRFFEAGVNTRGKNATTLWLSRRLFREVKGSLKLKMNIDSLPARVTVLGTDQMEIEVNRSSRSLPVIKTRDDRGMERWFLDMEDNPLLVNFLARNYQQKLTSITTDRANTLRWIKNKKKAPTPH